MKDILSKIKSAKSHSGVKVLAVSYGKTPRVIATFVIRSGAEKDPIGKEGLADLTTEALSFGTINRDFDAFHEEIERYGAILEMTSNWDVSHVTLSAPSESFEFLVSLYKELFFQPAFPQREISEAKKRRKAKLQRLTDISSWVADQLIWNLALQGSNYGHCALGNNKSIESLTVEDIKEFHRNYFLHALNVSIIVIGRKNIDGLLDLGLSIADEFRDTDGTCSSQETSLANTYSGSPKIIVVDRPDLTQSEIRVSLPGISRYDSDYYSFILMNYILGGGGFSSILMDRLRSQKGLTYGVKSFFHPLKVKGPMIISTFTPTAYTFQTFEELLHTLTLFPSHQNLERHLDEAKEFFKGNFPLRFDTPENLLKELVHLEAFEMPLDELLLFPDKISEITVDHVMRVAQCYLRLEHIKAIIIGRAENFFKYFESMFDNNEIKIMEFQNAIAEFL